MKCNDIGFGTYDCAYNIMLPWLCKFPWEPETDRVPKYVAIDKCLLAEVVGLWERGIKTTGCCCGHGRNGLAFIGAAPEHEARMLELGYTKSEGGFKPKSKLVYDDADKGFNWWDAATQEAGEASR